MTYQERIDAFVLLGDKIRTLSAADIDDLCDLANATNVWFDADNVKLSLQGIATYLEKESFTTWAKQYDFQGFTNKTVGVIMAGNIPLAGFHDLACVLLSGNRLMAKISSQDTFLPKKIINYLVDIAPEFENKAMFVERFTDFQAIIATGSNNSARYFDYYFGKYPHIIRKNRNSVAVLQGSESEQDIVLLGKDIFQYFGLGCRNVSKLFVPKGYDFRSFFEPIERFSSIVFHHKYANNYEYNKSIYLIKNIPHLDNGFLLVAENQSLHSPVAMMHYETYDDLPNLRQRLEAQQNEIQCVVAAKEIWTEGIAFGQTQQPQMKDYADKVDTMQFLYNIYG